MTGATTAIASTKRIVTMLLLIFSPMLLGGIFAQQTYSDTLRFELSKAKTLYEKVNIELQLAYVYSDVDADSLKHYANRVIEHSKQLKNDTLLCHGYLKYAMLFEKFPKTRIIDSTWYYIDKAYDIAKRAGCIREMGSCFELKGMVKSNTADKKGAINDLLEARKLYFQSGDTTESYLVAFSIAQTYEMAGIYDKALALYDSIGDIKALHKLNFYVTFLEIVGSSHQKVGQFDKSLKYYQKAYSYLQEAGDNCEKQRILMKLASAHHYLGNKDSANLYFDKTISYSDSCRVDNRQGNDCVRLADICFDNQKYTEAESYYLQSLDIVRQNGWSDSEMYTLQRLSNFYQHTKNYAKALDYFQQFAHLKDSLKIEPLGPMLEKALSDQELTSKTAELTRLKQQQAGMLQRTHLVMGYAIVIALLFVLIWIFQAGQLFNFAKNKLIDKQSIPAQSLWKQMPPFVVPNRMNSLWLGLLYTLCNVGCFYLFFREQSGALSMMVLSVFSLMMFVGFDRLMVYNQGKRCGLTFRHEFICLLLGVVPFALMLSGACVLLNVVDAAVEPFLYLALMALANYYFIIILRTLLLYRLRMDALSDHLMEEFNKKLGARQATLPTHRKQEHQPKPRQISIDSNGDKMAIDVDSLLFVKSFNVYQELICVQNHKQVKLLIRNTMANIEKQLSGDDQFLRCHRSYLVNTQKIKSVEGNTRQYYFVLEGTDEKIPISRSSADQMLEKFVDLMAY
jgi:tetratricopeptide (TPR) repeat protein